MKKHLYFLPIVLCTFAFGTVLSSFSTPKTTTAATGNDPQIGQYMACPGYTTDNMYNCLEITLFKGSNGVYATVRGVDPANNKFLVMNNPDYRKSDKDTPQYREKHFIAYKESRYYFTM